jgi:hypothetical protein
MEDMIAKYKKAGVAPTDGEVDFGAGSPFTLKRGTLFWQHFDVGTTFVDYS